MALPLNELFNRVSLDNSYGKVHVGSVDVEKPEQQRWFAIGRRDSGASGCADAAYMLPI